MVQDKETSKEREERHLSNTEELEFRWAPPSAVPTSLRELTTCNCFCVCFQIFLCKQRHYMICPGTSYHFLHFPQFSCQTLESISFRRYMIGASA